MTRLVTNKFTMLLLCFIGLCCCSLAATKDDGSSYQDLLSHFKYDASAPLGIHEVGSSRRNGSTVVDLVYQSPKGGTAPAYLVLPDTTGRHPAILFGHWSKDDAKIHDRREFLDEATAMARSGVVSLLIDAPMARPGYKEDATALSSQQPLVLEQEVFDLRRGVDLLTQRPDVDTKRIAYVGHSFNGGAGGILMGLEKRISTVVIMAGGLSIRENVLGNAPGTVAFRKSVGEEKVRRYLDHWDYLDPVHYLGHAAPASVLLQYGSSDSYESTEAARHYFALISSPKELKFYRAGHALNNAALLDRAIWLGSKLHFLPDRAELRKVPALSP